MQPFEPDGHYDGIPYRVLPDASIEVMTANGLVKFKNIDQLLAWATRFSSRGNAVRPNISPSQAEEEIKNVPIVARPLDYYSVLVNTIERAKNDSAHLRQLVYERARFNFKRDVLFGDPSTKLTDLVQHINDFELAVAQIEANAANSPQVSEYRQSERKVASIEAPKSETAQERAVRVESVKEAVEVGAPSSSKALSVLSPRAPALPRAEFSPVQQVEHPPYDEQAGEFTPHRRFVNRMVAMSIIGIVLIGIVLASGTLWFLLRTAPQIISAKPAPTVEKTVVIQQQPAPPNLPYPIPTSYGIYLLSENKLTELQALAMNVPDARVALSAEIKTPSSTVTSDNKPAFILFRRDLINNVPQKITLRVVARMARETKIVDGKATSTNIQGVWRIRNISRELRVSPVPGQREMIIARLEDNEPLAAGRYELNLNRIGYDFSVAGPIENPAQCIEQFESANGPIYTECKVH